MPNFGTSTPGSGIDVILDRYELKIGNETHSLMERSIEIADKILVVCDNLYRTKANERKGGAGIETMLLTKQVYQDDKQTKVIPVVVELDEKGEYCLPKE
ncbi:TIR domain-containing protein [Bacillus subtilis]